MADHRNDNCWLHVAMCTVCAVCESSVTHTHISFRNSHSVCVCVYADTQERMKHSRVGFTAQWLAGRFVWNHKKNHCGRSNAANIYPTHLSRQLSLSLSLCLLLTVCERMIMYVYVNDCTRVFNLSAPRNHRTLTISRSGWQRQSCSNSGRWRKREGGTGECDWEIER